MLKGCFWFLVVLLVGIFFSRDNVLNRPSGSPAEQVSSPQGRYIAQLWRCCEVYNYISGFEIRDTHTGRSVRQDLSDVEGLNDLAGGGFFAWTPSENYLVIVTDDRVTSHGCDELLVYTGDGRELVYSSVSTSVCRLLMTDSSIAVLGLCANDDILLYGGSRLIPSTGEKIQTDKTTCNDR